MSDPARSVRLSRRALLSLLGWGIVPAGARGVERLDRGRSRVLRMQNDSDIQNLDPANRHGWYDELVIFAIHSGLCQFRSGLQWGWALDAATELVPLDPLRVAFTLKPGRLWSHGFGEMTADDVRFSYERFIDPRNPAIYYTDWEALDCVQLTGRYSGIIRLKRPFAPLFTISLPGPSGTVVCRRAFEAAGGTPGTDPRATSGPYRIAQWLPRERLVLERNPLWSGTLPWFDEIELLPMDFREAETAYEAGDLDVTRIAVGALALLRQERAPDTSLSVRPALSYMWLGMNMSHPRLADTRVRRAIQQAINVADVLEAAFGTAVAPATGLIPPPLLGSGRRVLYPFDPDRARALLREAGRHELVLRLDFSHDTDRMTIAQVIQSQLRDVGITLHLHPMDAATFATEGQESEGDDWKDLQLSMQTFTASPDPSFVPAWFTCRQVGIWNTERFCDPTFDRLAEQAVSEQDVAIRAAMYRRLEDMLEESGAFLPLYHGLNAWACRKPVQGAFSPDGLWPMLRDMRGA